MKNSKKDFYKERSLFVGKFFLLVFVLYLRGFKNRNPEDFDQLPWLVDALFVLVTGHLVLDFIRQILIYLYLRKNKSEIQNESNFILGVNRIATVFTTIVVILSCFTALKIDVKSFFTSISIFAAALALLSKDYISNIINGLIMMFSDQISLNDYVRIGNNRGKIIDITLLNVHLVNDDDELIMLPNNIVFASDITNFTKRLEAKVGVEFDLPRENSSNPDELEKYLFTSVIKHQEFLKTGSFQLKVQKIESDLVRFRIQYTLKEENRTVEKEIRKILLREILIYPTKPKNH